MPDSSALDVLIGLALLFAAFSLAVSRINEAVLGLLHYRGRRLEAELRGLLGAHLRAHLRGGQNDPSGANPSGANPSGADSSASTPSDSDPSSGGPSGGNSSGGDPSGGGSSDGGPSDVVTTLFDGPLRMLRTAGHDEGSARDGGADLADHPPVGGGLAAVRRARRLRLPSYVPSTAFAQALVDLVDPPARAMLAQLRPDGLPPGISDDERVAYTAAYEAATRSLDEASAQALYAVTPEQYPAGRVIAAALVSAVEAAPVRTLEQGLAALPASPAKEALTAAVVRVRGDRDKLVAELAAWYDQAMDRLSGWYKRRVAVFMLCYAIVLAAAFNLDAVGIARAMWQDGAVRAAAVSAAGATVDQTPSASIGASAQQPPQDAAHSTEEAVRAVRDASGLALPIGWTRASDDRDDPREVPHSVRGWLLKILGVAVTCFALTAGAPFWFELLGRLVNMRSSGPKPRSTTGS
ncbi:conserved membrane hypothetical protein [Frankia sp. AiPs1]|uniref:hypothetical protein n=1 Tax=Frankia sp. AiPa1 TaxID=573492 RepID=UPI00202B976C|nr:hypothetical protein [Frankia sp. AiPa1]MCL9761441.1 hypothetical protein [Frankia sp. AiPa1]